MEGPQPGARIWLPHRGSVALAGTAPCPGTMAGKLEGQVQRPGPLSFVLSNFPLAFCVCSGGCRGALGSPLWSISDWMNPYLEQAAGMGPSQASQRVSAVEGGSESRGVGGGT